MPVNCRSVPDIRPRNIDMITDCHFAIEILLEKNVKFSRTQSYVVCTILCLCTFTGNWPYVAWIYRYSLVCTYSQTCLKQAVKDIVKNILKYMYVLSSQRSIYDRTEHFRIKKMLTFKIRWLFNKCFTTACLTVCIKLTYYGSQNY